MPGAATKSKKITAALLTLALLAFLSAGQACAAPQRYKDAELGFSFSYPETWRQLDAVAGITLVFAPPEDGVSANFAVSVTSPLELAVMTEDAFVEFYEMMMGDVEMLLYKTTKVGGAPCVFADMLVTIGKQQRRARQLAYMVNNKGKGYVLVFTTNIKDYGKCEDSFKMILDSFKF